MCYAYGSIDQAVNVCPMCKVFPHPSCPHTREVCRNRTAHPRFDVLYLKNAEVDWFNGCGYCKWARTNPSPKAAGYFNNGWPGCCRAPTQSEHRMIQPADWRSVSLVHHVPIPSEIKAALDNLGSRPSGSPGPPVSPVRSGPSAKTVGTSADSRRNSNPNRSSGKSAAMPIPTKSRTSGSPQMIASSITSNSSRGSGSSGGTSASVPNASTMEAHVHRKQRDKSADPDKSPGSSNSSPSRKHLDLDSNTTPRRNSGGRPPVSASSSNVSKVIVDALISGRHRSNSSTQPGKATSPVSTKSSSPPVRPVDAPKRKEKADAEAFSGSDPPRIQKKADPETSSTSSSGSESLTESTVTSTGEFTDYLSDESEAELQRQAEAKAALVAQNEAEELEFRAARQALANIGLRPPKSWAAADATRGLCWLAMNLGRVAISSVKPVNVHDARFEMDNTIFTVSTPVGFAVYRTCPLALLRKRELTNGTLAAVVPLHTSSLLFLLGGGPSPLYPPNKVVLWDDALGTEVAELEFRERVRGLACRRGWLAVALRRRVVVFQIGQQVTRHAEWDTCDNPRGLLALASGTYATLLAIPGKQKGHVQLIHLPPCPPPTPLGPPSSSPPRKPPPPPTRHPVAIIAAHTTDLRTLSVPPSGRLLATTSSQGTLVRTWDAVTGKLVREFRRGTDKAEIFGVAFRPDERELCVWSDKGTVHVFNLVVSGVSNRQSSLSPLMPYLPLPKYFESEWSYAQYRIPTQSSHISLSQTSIRTPTAEVDEERCVVGWIEAPSDADNAGGPVEYQLVALTYAGGWYRISLPAAVNSSKAASSSPLSAPRQRTESGSSQLNRLDKGKEKEKKDGSEKQSRKCVLEEFRRFGRWDGWG
ncbi:WD-repeats-region domain-containing protein [Favolaschia claudopus]|uniref:WD-repeats-region domain-containing protein n=1 Tax=Favolaschia claudopus TaxID=2862362 RepID=A0AAW0EB24_9AGAR